MSDLLRRLKERQLVRWGLAYLAAAWVVIEGLDALGGIFGVPAVVQRGVVVLLAFGLVVALILAWYHGEKGRQRVTGTELLLVAAVLGIAGLTLSQVGTGDVATGGAPSGPSEDVDPRSVAVLPFLDLSPGGDQAYLGHGVAEELRGELSRVDGLRVASGTSSAAVAGTSLAPPEIGRRLGVAHLVEGSVRKSAERLRIEARLVSAADGINLWSGRFDADAPDIFAIQDSIARAVARAFRIQLSGEAEDVARPGETRDHEAQDLYLRGRYAWNRRTRESLEEAVDWFRDALERDSTYARALVGLGDAYAVLGFYDYRAPAVAFPLAQDAARRAIAIDSTLAEPYATLGYAALYHDWDWDAAEGAFRQAIRLDPGYPVAHQWYANFLTARGRFDEAVREMRVASELDPLSMIAFAAMGWVHLYAREWDMAVAQLEETLARDPSFQLAWLWMGQAEEGRGRLDAAEERLRRAVELSGGSGIARAALARVLGLRGRADEARSLLGALEEEGRTAYVPSYEIARAFVGLGEPDTAIAWLERALEERAHSMAFLEVDPQFDALRPRSDFQGILRRVSPPD